jgi:hypothetical protein
MKLGEMQTAINAIKNKTDAMNCQEHSIKLKSVEKEVDGMICKEHTVKIDSHEKHINRMDSTIAAINENMYYIRGALNTLLGNGANATVQSFSPLSLTELGKHEVENLAIDVMVNKNWMKILDFLNTNVSSENAYDIQEFCMNTACVSLDKFFSESDVSLLKNQAFQTGNQLFYYGQIIGVLVRDKYFEHIGMDISEVDKHAPLLVS